jgi:hypothetical protein
MLPRESLEVQEASVNQKFTTAVGSGSPFPDCRNWARISDTWYLTEKRRVHEENLQGRPNMDEEWSGFG